MTPELIAILVTALLQTAMLGAIALMVYRMSNRQIANDDAAISRRIEEIHQEMRESLRR